MFHMSGQRFAHAGDAPRLSVEGSVCRDQSKSSAVTIALGERVMLEGDTLPLCSFFLALFLITTSFLRIKEICDGRELLYLKVQQDLRVQPITYIKYDDCTLSGVFIDLIRAPQPKKNIGSERSRDFCVWHVLGLGMVITQVAEGLAEWIVAKCVATRPFMWLACALRLLIG